MDKTYLWLIGAVVVIGAVAFSFLEKDGFRPKDSFGKPKVTNNKYR